MWNLVLFVSLAWAAYAAELAQPSETVTAPDILPKCVSNKAEVRNIEETTRRYGKQPFKYDAYRKTFRFETDVEMIARLAYAETLAAKCPGKGSQEIIAPRIVDTIVNRVKIRGNNGRGVIFERDQFASSLNIYGDSQYKSFLCPKNLELWRLTLAQARARMENSGKPVFAPNVVHYYFFKHNPKFAVPAWAKGPKSYPVASFPGEQQLNGCVRFFSNPNWR